MRAIQYLCPHCQKPMTVTLGDENMDTYKQLVQYRHAFCETCKEKILIEYFPYSRCHFPSAVQARQYL